MRYIDIQSVIGNIPQDMKDDLRAIDHSMLGLTDDEKEEKARGGSRYWTPVRPYLERASHGKCWYTESKNPGCPCDVDHFRPKAKVLNDDGSIRYWYWFLAFNPINYRLSSQISNRRNRNSVLREIGGKGNKFPLMAGSPRAMGIPGLAVERPVILDPCNQSDTELLEFQPDGRPVVSRKWDSDEDAAYRVEQSKLLLNLDFPTFNEGRERIYNSVKKLVDRGDRYVQEGNDALEDVRNDLRDFMRDDAEYSKAAECYIRCFRDRDWIEELFI